MTSSIRSLTPERIDFWQITWTQMMDAFQSAFLDLSLDEQQRALRIRHAATQHAFIYTRAALRRILADYLTCKTTDLVFHYNAFGKPFLIDNSQQLEFSVSHSHEIGLIAVTCGAPIGVDIEFMRRDTNGLSIARRFFAPSEASYLETRPEQFFTFWTLKEAVLKASGLGIGDLLHKVVIEAKEQPALVAVDPTLGTMTDWQIGMIDHLPASYLGAYAIKGTIGAIHYFHYS